MELSGLIAQRAIVLPLLADAHATLSATSSMGQLLVFESTVAPVVADLTAAVKARRVGRALPKALPVLSEASALIAGEELAETVEAAQTALRADKHNQAAFDGTAMGHIVLVMAALDRARLACAVMLDVCEGVGVAPNGKPLRPQPAASAPARPATDGNSLFETTL